MHQHTIRAFLEAATILQAYFDPISKVNSTECGRLTSNGLVLLLFQKRKRSFFPGVGIEGPLLMTFYSLFTQRFTFTLFYTFLI